MKKLNNKGFAISTMLYGLLTVLILLITMLMGTMAFNRKNSREFTDTVIDELEKPNSEVNTDTTIDELEKPNNEVNTDTTIDELEKPNSEVNTDGM